MFASFPIVQLCLLRREDASARSSTRGARNCPRTPLRPAYSPAPSRLGRLMRWYQRSVLSVLSGLVTNKMLQQHGPRWQQAHKLYCQNTSILQSQTSTARRPCFDKNDIIAGSKLASSCVTRSNNSASAKVSFAMSKQGHVTKVACLSWSNMVCLAWSWGN